MENKKLDGSKLEAGFKRDLKQIMSPLATAIAVSFAAPSAMAATFVVDNPSATPAAGTTNLYEAIEQANENAGHDTIVFDAGISSSTINVNQSLYVHDSIHSTYGEGLTIDGGAVPGLTIELEASFDSNRIYAGFELDDMAQVSISNLTIKHQDAADNSTGYGDIHAVRAIYGRGNNSLSLDNVTVIGNSSGASLGVAVHGDSFSMVDSSISNINYAYGEDGGSALLVAYGEAGLTKPLDEEEDLETTEFVTIANSEFENNHANDDSAPIEINAPYERFSINVTGSTFTDNSSVGGTGSQTAGAMVISEEGEGGEINVEGSTFTGNAGGVGALAIHGGYNSESHHLSVSITDTTVSGNTGVKASGVGVFLQYGYHVVAVSGSTFTNNVGKNDDAEGYGVDYLDSSGALAIFGEGIDAPIPEEEGESEALPKIEEEPSDFVLPTGISINDSTFTGNTTSVGTGGAISIAATESSEVGVEISGVTVTANSALSGGGLFFYAYDSEFEAFVDASNISDNDSSSDTRVVGEAPYEAVYVDGHEDLGQGGGIAALKNHEEHGYTFELSITNTTIANNQAGKGGGVAFLSQGPGDTDLNLSEVSLTGNTATDNANSTNNLGGGLFVDTEDASEYYAKVMITDTSITGNSAEAGGGLSLNNSVSAEIYMSTIASNMTVEPMNGDQSAFFEAEEGEGGMVDAGGGIAAFSYHANVELNISDTTIADNMAGSGGGIASYGEDSGGYVKAKAAKAPGGGNSSVSLAGVTLSGNDADGEDGMGGGIHAVGSDLNLVNTTLAENTGNKGSALNLGQRVDLTMLSSTIAHNSVDSLYGAAVYANGVDPDDSGEGTQYLEIHNTIIASNFVTIAASVDADDNPVAEQRISADVVVDADGVDADDDGHMLANMVGSISVTGLDDENIDQVSLRLSQSADNVTVFDPLLGPLGSNGGPTETVCLASGSAARDSGNVQAVLTEEIENDQTGENRVEGAGVDIGALEMIGTACTAEPGPSITVEQAEILEEEAEEAAAEAAAAAALIPDKSGSGSGPFGGLGGGLLISLLGLAGFRRRK